MKTQDKEHKKQGESHKHKNQATRPWQLFYLLIVSKTKNFGILPQSFMLVYSKNKKLVPSYIFSVELDTVSLVTYEEVKKLAIRVLR